MKKNRTLVIFRRWPDTGELIALFPELPANETGTNCLSYQRVGQHGAADFRTVSMHTEAVATTKAATVKDPDVISLMRELEQAGYVLHVIQRASYGMHVVRRRILEARGRSMKIPRESQ